MGANYKVLDTYEKNFILTSLSLNQISILES